MVIKALITDDSSLQQSRGRRPPLTEVDTAARTPQRRE